MAKVKPLPKSPPLGGSKAAQRPEGGKSSDFASTPPSSAPPTLPPRGGDFLARLSEAVTGYGVGPIRLEVAVGEIVALVGASGSGKSTALRLLAGLERPEDGQAILDLERGQVGFVFQSATLMPWATARDNVALPLILSGVGPSDAAAKADHALARVGLGDHQRLRPAALSGGMAMRVSLARALVGRPRLLLLDEPFSALDSITRRRLIDDLHGLWTEDRPAIVFVTHDIDEAAYVAGRALIMGPGGTVADEIGIEGPLPRPEDWRSTPGHLAAVGRIERAFAATMQSPLTGGRQAAKRPEGGVASDLASTPPSSSAVEPGTTLPPKGGDFP